MFIPAPVSTKYRFSPSFLPDDHSFGCVIKVVGLRCFADCPEAAWLSCSTNGLCFFEGDASDVTGFAVCTWHCVVSDKRTVR